MKYYVWHGTSANTETENAIVNNLHEVQRFIENKLTEDNIVGVEILMDDPYEQDN